MKWLELPRVDPMPPAAPGWPVVGAGPALLRQGADFFAAQRARLGDTFLVDAFRYRLFCVFSPAGVRALYAFPEREASFGLATYELVMRHKLPLELVAGRRTRPHDLFGSQEVEGYLAHLEEAVARQLAELGDTGRFEIFAFARRLGHRLGLACWAGPEAAARENLDRLIPLFDRLDTSSSFVQPTQAFAAHATRKWRERRAMRGIERILGEILAARRSAPPRGDFLVQIDAAWGKEPEPARTQGVARDVMLIHMGAQSNLYAALAWTLVDLLLRPALLEEVRVGDDALLERCASESIRMAQRSLTLRRVMQPLTLELEHGKFRLEPGVLIATMLAATNRSAAPGLDRFDPAHYEGRRLAKGVELPARELVSTFGHGRHACPAQRFSISAIRIAVRRLLERYELSPRFTSAAPRRRQIGAVARAERPCEVEYCLR
ncbi:MAG TPA: cytochrome [Myxococcota bacterium]|nr:cytochrome [Myxococcota bacterium]